LLVNIHKMSVEDQKQELEKEHELWKEGVEQIDDIMVMGLFI